MTQKNRHEEFLQKAQEGLERAAQDALARGRRMGTPVWVWENGEWVDALAEERGRRYKPSAEPGAVVREDSDDSEE